MDRKEYTMSSNQYTRERKEDKPVLAICYDFDKTLSPDDMQAQGYIMSKQKENSQSVLDIMA